MAETPDHPPGRDTPYKTIADEMEEAAAAVSTGEEAPDGPEADDSADT